MARTYSIDREDGDLEVWIPSQARLASLVIGGVLLAYYIPAVPAGTPLIIESVQRAAQALPPGAAPWFALAVYAVWFLVGVVPAVAGVLILSYQFLGWEHLTLTAEGLTLKREVFGLGRRRRFPPGALGDLRLVPGGRNDALFLQTGALVFGPRGGETRFGARLAPDGADAVFAALREGAAAHVTEEPEEVPDGE